MTNFYNFYRLFCLYGFKILAMFNNVLIMGAHGGGGPGEKGDRRHYPLIDKLQKSQT
jgi:hypothetical protein